MNLREFAKSREPHWTKQVLRPWIVTLTRGVILAFYNNVLSNLPGYGLRKWYLARLCAMKIGAGSSVHMGCFVTGRKIVLGSRSVVNRRCYLDGRVGLKIGDNVSISPEVYIISSSHDPHDPYFCGLGGYVIIEDYAWIGARAIILPKVTLGRGCVVGAGAVVTKPVLPYQIVAGNPARVIGQRQENLLYAATYFPLFNTDEVLPDLFSAGD